MASEESMASANCSAARVCTAIPDYILQDIADSNGVPRSVRDSARRTLNRIQRLRTARTSASSAPNRSETPVPERGPDEQTTASGRDRNEDNGGPASFQSNTESTASADANTSVTAARQWRLDRNIYDANHSNRLSGNRLIRREGQLATPDISANEVYEALGKIFEFFKDVFQRNSIDGNGLSLVSSIHYDDLAGEAGLHNVFWTWPSRQVVFGDGNNFMFGSMTKSLDVIAHEVTHGIVDYTADLAYHLQAGALNEHICDVFASMIKQYHLSRQESRAADWLIGTEILAPGFQGRGLRDMKNPGQAYADSRMGGRNDRQVGHMRDYKFLPDSDDPYSDNGGVHVNSGIPNRAFYLIATQLGGHSWDVAGPIWYATLRDSRLRRFAARAFNWDKCFDKFAGLTCAHARAYGDAVHDVVKASWLDVGITPTDEVLPASL